MTGHAADGSRQPGTGVVPDAVAAPPRFGRRQRQLLRKVPVFLTLCLIAATTVYPLLFRSFFAYDGPVNDLLGHLGVAPIDWMSSGPTAIAVVILALVWSSFGYGMLILLAGMAAIDPSVYEAARLDGAGWWQRTSQITLPLIARPMRFLSVINVIYTFTSLFGFIFVMTSGGPGYETTTVDYFIYLKAFAGFNLGGGAALAVMLFFVILGLTTVQFRVFRDDEDAT